MDVYVMDAYLEMLQSFGNVKMMPQSIHNVAICLVKLFELCTGSCAWVMLTAHLWLVTNGLLEYTCANMLPENLLQAKTIFVCISFVKIFNANVRYSNHNYEIKCQGNILGQETKLSSKVSKWQSIKKFMYLFPFKYFLTLSSC